MKSQPWLVLAVIFCLQGRIPPLVAADQPVGVTERPTNGAAYFERHVRPLLHQHCYECHSERDEAREGELTLDSVAGIKRGGSRGPLFVPGKPEKSLVLQALQFRHDDVQMPPAGKLPAAALSRFEQWIRIGAPLPKTDSAVVPNGAGIDLAEARRFWSFQLLDTQPTPETASEWPKQKIDAFVLDALDENGLQPSEPADRATWIRRLTFDLTGLPPTPAEVAAYVTDSSPDADVRLVDRLLSSPHYGERWARYWLDLARYTDVTASWLHSAENAFLYRDWVVRAWNEDRPYDEFVELQLAADLQAGAAPGDIAALGFLGLSPSYWKELRLAPDLIKTVVADEWEERVDAVSRTFLGLTVACAKCHDHKFDPISMRDYYALAGVFASSQLALAPLAKEPEASRIREAHEQVQQLEAKLAKIKDQNSDAALQTRESIASIRNSTPHYDVPFANAVVEAAIYVVPDGPNKTKLEYRDGKARNVPLYRRGNPRTPGDPVPRGFPAVLSDGKPIVFTEGSGRRELAHAVTHAAGPLAARVMVNRIWQHHFGQGLVRTPSDFGTQGDRPTHPELLDDLAARFVEHGWSVKWLQREIVLSATYRQASGDREAGRRIDPENRLLWRMPRRKLEIEAWRDALLSVAGTLDRRIGGPPTVLEDAANRRRTIYGKVGRHELNDMLRLHDFPEPSSHSPARENTTTPLQQLFLMNSSLVEEQSRLLAARLLRETPGASRPERIASCYQLLFSRKPTEAEAQMAEEFLQTSESDLPSRWQRYVHVLVGLNEFAFVD